MAKKKKNSREKRALVGAVGVAAVIMAGSTFAWFSSKDEVTNRLSASANYGVTIAENFTPPSNWIPGQTVNKDVSAVNTGNIDAFVRMWFGGELNLLSKDSQNDAVAYSSSFEDNLADVEDTSMISLGLLKSDSNGKFYKILSQTSTINPNDKIQNPDDYGENDGDEIKKGSDGDDEEEKSAYSEVQAIQAGGYLVYAENDGFTYKLNQDTELLVWTTTHGEDGSDVNAWAYQTIPAGTTVEAVKDSDGTTAWVTGRSTNADTAYVYLEENIAIEVGGYGISQFTKFVDSDSFKPAKDGLYLFARYIELSGKELDENDVYKITGYYYDADEEIYYALNYEESDEDGNDSGGNYLYSDYVLPDEAVKIEFFDDTTYRLKSVAPTNDLKLYTVSFKEITADDSNFTWEYEGYEEADRDAQPTIVFTYDPENDTDHKITIYAVLANIGNSSEEWTAKGTDKTATFYYNNDVEAGDTTTKLVDYVVLGKETTQKAFIAFDFDLNVFLESYQVTTDQYGKELPTAVEDWSATEVESSAINTGATVAINNITYDSTEHEIETIGWQG